MEKNNNLLKICLVLLVVIVAIESIFIIRISKNEDINTLEKNEEVVNIQKEKNEKMVDAPEQQNEKVADVQSEKEIVINSIKTPLVDFVYGFESVDGLKVRYNSEEPYEVTFFADLGDVKNIEILKFYFDSDNNGTTIGIINDKNGHQVKVSVDQAKFDDSLGLGSDELTRLFSVQEELLDVIVSNFEIVEYVSEGIVLEEGYVVTETPYFKILFSNEWEDYLLVEQIEGEPYKVVFSCKFEGYEPVELFTYMFGEGAEGVLGYLRGVPVGLSIGTAEADKNWNEEQNDIFYNMREEMNYIIDHLVATGEFSFN